MSRTLLIVIACLAGLLLAAGWLLKSQIASNSVLKMQISQSQQTLQKYQDQQKSVELVDQHYQQVLNDAKAENDRLNASVAAGRLRLRFYANCVPTAATTPSVSDGPSTAELNGNITQALFAITQRGDSAITQLTALQSYVATVCQPH